MKPLSSVEELRNLREQAQRKMAERDKIVQVKFHPLFHLFQGFGLTPPAIDLGPAGEAGPDLVPEHIARDETAVVFIVRHRMGPGPHDGHGTVEHIEKLGQLIQAGAPQKPAERGHSP